MKLHACDLTERESSGAREGKLNKEKELKGGMVERNSVARAAVVAAREVECDRRSELPSRPQEELTV